MTTARRRVAVTGVGLVTPVGNDVETTWNALLEGRSGGAPISLFDASGFSTWIAAEVKDFENVLVTDRKLLKMTNRSHRFALEAAEQALLDAGIRPTAADAHRWGCAVGAGMMTADFDDLVETHAHAAPEGELVSDRLLTDGPANDPIVFCRGQAAEGLALLTRRYGIHGYATSVHTACASGGQAFGTAMKLIRRGYVDRVLAGGFDSMISPIGIAGFCLLSALSADNDTPQRASRPFDATRNGFLLGEGAGFVVLEEWNAARARGAHIYAELAGDGNSLSSYRITDSPPAAQCACVSTRSSKSAVIMPAPTAQPQRCASSAVGRMPASRSACSAASSMNRCERLVNLKSLRSVTSVLRKSLTSAAMCVEKPLASKRLISAPPLRPASSASHVVATSLPTGVTKPTPVTATLRRASFMIESPSVQSPPARSPPFSRRPPPTT